MHRKRLQPGQGPALKARKLEGLARELSPTQAQLEWATAHAVSQGCDTLHGTSSTWVEETGEAAPMFSFFSIIPVHTQ